MPHKWLDRHSWLIVIGALLAGLVNVYEAMYIHPDSLMGIIDWAFAVSCFLVFVGLLLNAISDHLSKADD
jgi:hypothetical protein